MEGDDDGMIEGGRKRVKRRVDEGGRIVEEIEGERVREMMEAEMVDSYGADRLEMV